MDLIKFNLMFWTPAERSNDVSFFEEKWSDESEENYLLICRLSLTNKLLVSCHFEFCSHLFRGPVRASDDRKMRWGASSVKDEPL